VGLRGSGYATFRGMKTPVVEAALAVRPRVDPGAAQEMLDAGGEIGRTGAGHSQLVSVGGKSRVVVEQRRGREDVTVGTGASQWPDTTSSAVGPAGSEPARCGATRPFASTCQGGPIVHP